MPELFSYVFMQHNPIEQSRMTFDSCGCSIWDQWDIPFNRNQNTQISSSVWRT